MVAVRARFANDDETLWPGETVEVTLTLATLTNVVVVPVFGGAVGAVRTVSPRGQTGPQCRTAARDHRQPGWRRNHHSFRHPAGERLITAGQERVTPGKRLKIHAEPSHSLASSP